MSTRVDYSNTSPINGDRLYTDGPVIDVEITAPVSLVRYLKEKQLPPYPTARGYALIDTGAAISAVDGTTFEELEIPSVDAEVFQTTHGTGEMFLFNASANFPKLQFADFSLDHIPGGSIRSSTAAGPEIITLLGRDFLRLVRFSCDGPKSSLGIEI